MRRKKARSLNYYFLSKHIHAERPRGFRQTIINFLVNINGTHNRQKHLFVQERNGVWGLARQGVVSQDLVENLFETIIRNIGEEFGFKGLKVTDTKPEFIQKAYFFNIGKQIYDEARAKAEEKRNRPSKGKLYHLLIMTYTGPDELPIDTTHPAAPISAYRWVNSYEGRDLLAKNYDLLESRDMCSGSLNFRKMFYERILNVYKFVQDTYSAELGPMPEQKSLFG